MILKKRSVEINSKDRINTFTADWIKSTIIENTTPVMQ